jgi:isoquinoline 1-oxidoreductase alpha subunit
MKTRLNVNGVARQVTADADTPLLWVLREDLGLPGTKFGCGAGICGACTVHLDGEAARSCQVPLAEVGKRAIVTIEGLAATGGKPQGGDGSELHRVQAAWLAEQVPQCGYCQPGMIMAVAAVLKATPDADPGTITGQVTNICRCGTHSRIVSAITRLLDGKAEV